MAQHAAYSPQIQRWPAGPGLVGVAEIVADCAVEMDVHQTRQRIGTARVNDLSPSCGAAPKTIGEPSRMMKILFLKRQPSWAFTFLVIIYAVFLRKSDLAQGLSLVADQNGSRGASAGCWRGPPGVIEAERTPFDDVGLAALPLATIRDLAGLPGRLDYLWCRPAWGPGRRCRREEALLASGLLLQVNAVGAQLKCTLVRLIEADVAVVADAQRLQVNRRPLVN